MKHYDFEINLLLDGELPESDKDELFTHLSKCRECSDAFSQYLLVKEKSKEFCIQNLDSTLNKNAARNRLYKYSFYMSAAAVVILIMLLAGIKLQPVYVTKVHVKTDTVYVQDKTGILALNQTIKPPMILAGNKLSKGKPESKFLYYVFSLPSEKITDADLIKQYNRSVQ